MTCFGGVFFFRRRGGGLTSNEAAGIALARAMKTARRVVVVNFMVAVG
jgi:hypothetical protein